MQTFGVEQNFKYWAQMGYAARGAIYLVIGGLALMAAFGKSNGQTTDSRGAIMTILEQPFGQFLLALLIVGLIGYTIWRLIQAIKDTDGHGTSIKGIGVRVGLVVSAITHGALALWASLLLYRSAGGDTSQSGGESSSQDEGMLASDWGPWLLGIAGVAVIIAGFAHVYKGWSARFERYMDIPREQNTWARPLCQFGLIARGVVWFIVGWFFINSARTAQQGEIAGMSEALAALRDAGYGPWLLAIVAAGLFAFGVYSVLEALYRRIDTRAA